MVAKSHSLHNITQGNNHMHHSSPIEVSTQLVSETVWHSTFKYMVSIIIYQACDSSNISQKMIIKFTHQSLCPLFKPEIISQSNVSPGRYSFCEFFGCCHQAPQELMPYESSRSLQRSITMHQQQSHSVWYVKVQSVISFVSSLAYTCIKIKCSAKHLQHS